MKVITIFLVLLVLSACGPGALDSITPIAGDYYFSDAGGMEKTIIYRGNAAQLGIVVDARVDKYRILDNLIVVARRPRLVAQDDGRPTTSTLGEVCEHWIINTKTQVVTLANNRFSGLELPCNSPYDQEFNPRS